MHGLRPALREIEDRKSTVSKRDAGFLVDEDTARIGPATPQRRGHRLDLRA
jgi:hypothetical protein